MKASFHLIPRLLTPSIVAGETIEILLFISGYGNIIKNKLNLTHSSKELIDEKTPGYILSNVYVKTDPETNEQKITIGKAAQEPSKHKLDTTGTHIVLSPHYFLDRNKIPKENVPPPPNHGLPAISGEIEFEKTPPIVIKIKTNSDAPSGDHKIDLTLTYVSNGSNGGNGGGGKGSNDNPDDNDNFDVQTDHKEVTVHVKNWMEKDGWKWAIAGTLIALGSLLYPVIIQIFPCLQNANLC